MPEVCHIFLGPLPVPVAGHLHLERGHHGLVEVAGVQQRVLRTGYQHENVNFQEVCQLGDVELPHGEHVALLAGPADRLLQLLYDAEVVGHTQRAHQDAHHAGVLGPLDGVVALHEHSVDADRLRPSRRRFWVKRAEGAAVPRHHEVPERRPLVADKEHAAISDTLTAFQREPSPELIDDPTATRLWSVGVIVSPFNPAVRLTQLPLHHQLRGDQVGILWREKRQQVGWEEEDTEGFYLLTDDGIRKKIDEVELAKS